MTLLFWGAVFTGLYGVSPVPSGKQSHSSTGLLAAAESKLATDYATLLGLVQDVETALCGTTVESGLQIGSSGSYTNCNGGAVAAYGSWNNVVNTGSTAIKNINQTSNSECAQYEDGKCVEWKNDVTQQIANACNGSIIPALEGQSANVNAIQSAINLVTVPANPANPPTLQQAMTVMSSILDSLGGLVSSSTDANILSLIHEQITTTSNLLGSDGSGTISGSQYEFNNCWLPYSNTSNACFNSNTPPPASVCNSLPSCTSDLSDPSPCGAQLQPFLNDFAAWTNSAIALFDAIKGYEPTLEGQYSIVTTNSPIIGCVLPNDCLTPCPPCGGDAQCTSDQLACSTNCQYNMPELVFNYGGAIAIYLNTINAVNNLVNEYYSTSTISTSNGGTQANPNYNPQAKLNLIINRMQAIQNQAQVLVNDFNQAANAQGTLLQTCVSDIEKSEQIESLVIGIITGAVIGITTYGLMLAPLDILGEVLGAFMTLSLLTVIPGFNPPPWFQQLDLNPETYDINLAIGDVTNFLTKVQVKLDQNAAGSISIDWAHSPSSVSRPSTPS